MEKEKRITYLITLLHRWDEASHIRQGRTILQAYRESRCVQTRRLTVYCELTLPKESGYSLSGNVYGLPLVHLSLSKESGRYSLSGHMSLRCHVYGLPTCISHCPRIVVVTACLVTCLHVATCMVYPRAPPTEPIVVRKCGSAQGTPAIGRKGCRDCG